MNAHICQDGNFCYSGSGRKDMLVSSREMGVASPRAMPRGADEAGEMPELVEASGKEEERIKEWRNLAAQKASQGDRAYAIELLGQLLAHRESAIDYNNRGLLYYYDGELDLALADYNRAVALAPALAATYNNRANCYAAKGELVEAIEDYDMAIDLNPFHGRALINQGIAFRHLEMYDLAIQNFDMALGLGQMEGYIYAQRGRTYQEAGDWNCAIADYHRALEVLTQPSRSPAKLIRRWRFLVETWLDQLMSMTTA